MPLKSSLVLRYTLILIIGVSVFVLLSLSWPRLRASLAYLPVDTAISMYWKTREINAEQVDALIDRAHEAITLYDHYLYWQGLSELQIIGGLDADRPYWQRRPLLEQSLISATEVVRRAPTSPRDWLRIARVRAFLGYTQEDILPAWKMSVLTGRVEPTLMPVRLELGFGYFNALDQDGVSLLRDQAVLSWSVNKRQVLKRLKRGSLSFDLMREVLAGLHPDIVAEMEAYLGRTGAEGATG